MPDYILTLFLLILLQAVLGFDNLLYISLESKRVRPEKQAFVRRLGIGLAVFFRIALLFVVLSLVSKFEKPLFSLKLGNEGEPNSAQHGESAHGAETTDVANATGTTDATHAEEASSMVHGFLDGSFTLHSLIVLLGGGFILYTAIKEIFHMIGTHDIGHGNSKPASITKTVTLIVTMNVIFSFDSILSAMALAKNPETGNQRIELIIIAIVASGALMIWLADRVANFLQKNRMYEVLGLFILFIVGIMLVTEGGHLAHLHLFGNPIVPMTKTTFYFVIAVLVVTDIVQGRYQKKLLAKQAKHAHTAKPAHEEENTTNEDASPKEEEIIAETDKNESSPEIAGATDTTESSEESGKSAS